MITSVTPGMPADAMGLRANDILVEYDGQPTQDLATLQQILQQAGIQGRHSVRIVRERNHAILDVVFPENRAGASAGATEPPLEPQRLDELAPAVDVDDRLVHDPTPPLPFNGVIPLITTEAELMNNAVWGSPRETTLVTNSLSLLRYTIKKYDVWVALWNGQVQTVDIRLPDGVQESQMVTVFQLGGRRDSERLPPEAAVGTKTEPNWRVQRYRDYRVILFLDGDDADPQVRLVRFFGQPRSLAEQLSAAAAETPALETPPADAAAAPEPEPEQESEPVPVPHEIVNSVGMRFVLVPSGTFRMGSSESVPELVAAFGADATKLQIRDEQPQRHRHLDTAAVRGCARGDG